MNLRLLNLLTLALLVLVLALNSRTVIPAHERGVVLRFGDITHIGMPPGVYWRLPVVEQVQRVDMRTHFSDLDRDDYRDARGDAMRVDAWVTWRIRDLPRFYLRTGADNARTAELLQPLLREGLQRAIAAAPWPELRAGLPAEALQGIVRQANLKAQRELGIELLALRVKRLAYTPAVQAVVIDRMRLARTAQVAALRAEALEQAAAVQAAAQQEQRATLAQAEQDAAALQADGAREAAAILAAAARPDPALARYWRALEDWRRGFGKPGDVFVLAAGSDLAALRQHLHLDTPAAPATEKTSK